MRKATQRARSTFFIEIAIASLSPTTPTRLLVVPQFDQSKPIRQPVIVNDQRAYRSHLLLVAEQF